jgi:hypothetical protein
MSGAFSAQQVVNRDLRYLQSPTPAALMVHLTGSKSKVDLLFRVLVGRGQRLASLGSASFTIASPDVEPSSRSGGRAKDG